MEYDNGENERQGKRWNNCIRDCWLWTKAYVRERSAGFTVIAIVATMIIVAIILGVVVHFLNGQAREALRNSGVKKVRLHSTPYTHLHAGLFLD